MREINAEGRDLVKRWEGIADGDPRTVNLDPYLDPVHVWTIGWGHAIQGHDGRFLSGEKDAAKVKLLYPDGITLQQAEHLLTADLIDASAEVVSLVKVPVTDNQFSALTSFQFNTGALRHSTLLRMLNNKDYDGAANQFARWNKGRLPSGTLVTLPGLVSRRADERALFVKKEAV